MPDRYDIAVIGAGPAGLAAAAQASAQGASVALIDQAPRIGGAYWRHGPEHQTGALHREWATFIRLRDRLIASPNVEHFAEHSVWAIQHGFEVHALGGERERRSVTIQSDHVIVATGTHDRTVACPGWTLPGVMTAGGAQALLKGSGVVPPGRVVVAGTGPLLLVVAAGFVRTGADVVAVVEANHLVRYAPQMRSWPGLSRRIGETVSYATALAKARVPILAGHQLVEVLGDQYVTGARIAGGRRGTRDIDCETVLIGYGFTPQVELLLQLDVSMCLDGDGSLVAAVDEFQRTSVAGVYAAGETTGVGGARLAQLEGWVAGRAAFGDVSVPPRVRRAINAERAFAAVMHRVHRVEQLSGAQPDVVVCRCEGVTAGHLAAVQRDLGADDVRTAKLLTRAGMGRCQGRVCGRLVEELLGCERTVASALAASKRPIATPVPLSTLASLPGIAP